MPHLTPLAPKTTGLSLSTRAANADMQGTLAKGKMSSRSQSSTESYRDVLHGGRCAAATIAMYSIDSGTRTYLGFLRCQ